MNDKFLWFVGLDWAHEEHRICLLDGEGKQVAERDVSHDGASLSGLCDWLLERTGAQPGEIAAHIAKLPAGTVPGS